MGTSRPRTQDFFPAPALSLSLAGAFAGNAPAEADGDEVEEGDEESGGAIIRGDLRLGDAAGISSENTGPPGSPSGGGSGDEGGHGDGGDQKRRKSYHRHTAEQIGVMEAMFKESPHPDEKQRQQLSKQLGLSARQVKFWFQNRRTQIKAIQEQQENSLLKSEMEKLQEENRAMRELIKKPSHCPSCGVAAATEDHLLRLENARLKTEIERLRASTRGGRAADAVASTTSPPRSPSAVQINSSISFDDYVAGGLLGQDKARILELAGRALDELKTMCSAGEPLWVRSVETGRDVLNYDEYVRLFPRDDDCGGDRRAGWSVEASRAAGVVYLETTQLVRAFMDVNQWKELFPSMISNASTLSVVQTGEDGDQDGVVQLMFAELQMLAPVVPTREVCFLRYCKKLGAEKWATVDVSFDKAEPDAQKSAMTVCKCVKKPSGCIIEEQTNGHCKVTWVEHTTCRDATVPSMYRAATASGLAFGARRWVAALQLQCERRVFSVATNIPTRDSIGVATMAGRRSVLKLAHRMTSSLCRGIGASRGTTWSKAPNGGGVRVTSRTNTGDPGEPQGMIACAVLSTWLPVSPTALLDFLRDETRRHEWDVMLPGGSVQSCVNVTKGKDRGNCVTIYAAKSPAGEQDGKWILQDSCVGPCESIVAYAPVDAAALRPVVDGHDSSGVGVLPCGFAVTPDGLDSKPAVITSSKDDDGAAGSLVTLAVQVLATTASPTDDALPADSVETVTGMVACTLGNIKKALRCEDC